MLREIQRGRRTDIKCLSCREGLLFDRRALKQENRWDDKLDDTLKLQHEEMGIKK